MISLLILTSSECPLYYDANDPIFISCFCYAAETSCSNLLSQTAFLQRPWLKISRSHYKKSKCITMFLLKQRDLISFIQFTACLPLKCFVKFYL